MSKQVSNGGGAAERSVTIRRMSAQGSTPTVYAGDAAIAEAEKILTEARGRGALIVDQDTQEKIGGRIPVETSRVMVVDPIAGGSGRGRR